MSRTSSKDKDRPVGDNVGSNEPPGLACNRCRTCKLRCSRERPACGHCRKSGLDCAYKAKRIKPGLKAGAVETLHRRLDALEQMVRERDDSDDNMTGNSTSSPSRMGSHMQDSIANSIVSLLAKELPKLVEASSFSSEPDTNVRKRRRLAEEDGAANYTLPETFAAPDLPAPGLLDMMMDVYFSHIHHWIPMVHRTRLTQRLQNPREHARLAPLLHAMVISASRYVQEPVIADRASYQSWLIAVAMQSLSVESLQALIIIAFTQIGNGNAEQAWPIVGSLTRTVEYLRLTVEHDDDRDGRQPLSQAFCPVGPAEDWTEGEERRRVFWNVFCLDRLCSVTMGWNTSLTSDDVCRRLPCEGRIWRREEPVLTPYFGIWDKSAAKIGNLIAAPSPTTDTSDAPIMVNMGAFAYAIEATESMSRVTSYFLQQRVNMNDGRQISAWLTRFKELDLRLVHWKMLLPQSWKSDNVVNMASHGTTRMDPNLTVAHVIHNTSMILLHQLIAYPPRTWGFRDKLPSTCSAETCHSAAMEIATIMRSYLHVTSDSLPVCPQLAFCMFVAARVFLIHWRYYGESQPADGFCHLAQSLEDMSHRWKGANNTASGAAETEQDLACQYATKLQELHRLCSDQPGFSINVAGYTTEIPHREQHAAVVQNTTTVAAAAAATPKAHHPLTTPRNSNQCHPDMESWAAYANSDKFPRPQSNPRLMSATSHSLSTPGTPLLPMSSSTNNNNNNNTNNTAVMNQMGWAAAAAAPEYPNELFQAFVDQSFVDMDRVISLDGGNIFEGDAALGVSTTG